MTKGSTFKSMTRSEPIGSLRRRAVHTQRQLIQQQQVRAKTFRNEPCKREGSAKMETKSGTEQRLIFRAPDCLLSSVPDGVVSQKGHIAEFLPE